MELLVEYAPIVLTGSLIGFLLHLTGVGGGILLIPALNVFFGMDITLAVGTAGLYMTISRLFSLVDYTRQKQIGYRQSLYLLLGATPTILIVGYGVGLFFSTQSDEAVDTFKRLLEYLVIVIIIFSIAVILSKRYKKPLKKSDPSGTNTKSPQKLGAVGVFVGISMALTGVGGGILIIPTLMKLTDMNTKTIVGSSIFIAFVLSVATSIIYAGAGLLDYKTALLMVAGSFAGIPFGSMLVRRINDRTVENIIIFLIVVSLVVMLIV